MEADLVAVDPAESIEEMERFRTAQKYPWPVAETDRKTFESLRITRQSTKIALDPAGTIVYRDGFGRGDPTTWHRVFGDLASAAGMQ